MIRSILFWCYDFFQSFISALFGMEIEQGVSVGSLMIVCGIFLLVVSNIMLIAKRN